MKNTEFSKIRKLLGKTQKQLAQQLCISIKAIQSYEQGWRNIPTYHEQQMLLLLYFKNAPNKEIKPCWDLTVCPDEWKDNCIVWELKARNLCWVINGTFCQGRTHKSWDEKIEICRKCEVFKPISGVLQDL